MSDIPIIKFSRDLAMETLAAMIEKNPDPRFWSDSDAYRLRRMAGSIEAILDNTSMLHPVERVENSFIQGVVYALARLAEQFDQPTMALEILQESGLDVSRASEYDVAFLRRHAADLPKGIS